MSDLKEAVVSSATQPRISYDCDTSPYWCDEVDYHNRDRRFGHFTEKGQAYEILDRDTPRPWLNYLCNNRFGSVLSNDGLGFTFYKTTLLRITQYDHPIDYLPREFKEGRRVFLRDLDTGKQWNVFEDSENLKCVHRPGSTTLTAVFGGLEVEMIVFVAVKDPVECWMIKLRNKGPEKRRLELAAEQVWAFARFGIHTAEEGIPYLSTPGKNLDIHTEPGTLWAHTDNSELPFALWGLFASPQLKKSQCLDEHSARKDGRIFTFKRCRLSENLELEPGEEREVEVVSGVEEEENAFGKLRERYAAVLTYPAEFEKVRDRWKTLLQYPSCEIPEPDLQNFLNVWLKNQLFLTFRFVRSGQAGYRDVLQDTWGYSLLEPVEAERRLLEALAHMKIDGSCPRNYSVLDSHHDHRAFMDSGTWIPMALVDYVKETGNLSILDEKLPYLEDYTLGSVQEHVSKALDLLFTRRGRHGLCLVGEGDWNDALEGISRGGAAESAWLTMALFHAQNLMAELHQFAGDEERSKTLRWRSAELRKTLHRQAWDGNWYLYGYTGTGKPIGSKENREGKIHLNAQSWAIFSGLADEGQVRKIRRAVADHLETELGPALLAPPYAAEGEEVGRIARLEPGTFENGSVYQHAAAFQILADIQSGFWEKGYRTLLKLLPTNPDNFDSRRTSEPYCTGNFYCGPGHPRFGQNFFSWFTGNAAWILRIGYDHLLGVKAEFNGLHIEPNVPSTWNRFSVKRLYRGTCYNIHFQRERGYRKYLMVDGEKIKGRLVTPSDKKEVTVQVFY